MPLVATFAKAGARVTIPDGSTWGTAIPRADGSGLYVTEEDGMTSELDLARGVRSRLPGMDTYSGAAGEPRYQGVVVGVQLRP